MSVTLDYADGRMRVRPSSRLRFAAVCGALPLMVGIGIFLLWLVTGAELLELAGIFTLVGGTVLVLIGALVLASDAAPRRSSAPQPEPGVHRRRALVGLLLLSNVPVAAAIVWGGDLRQQHVHRDGDQCRCGCGR